jgi:hypothetical protein
MVAFLTVNLRQGEAFYLGQTAGSPRVIEKIDHLIGTIMEECA